MRNVASRVDLTKVPLTIVDQQSKLRVDAQALGVVSAGESKLVKVDAGDHLIEAQAEDLEWEGAVHVEKPGQIIVKTGLLSMRAAKRWVGEWIGGTDYGAVTYHSDETPRTRSSTQYSHYFEWFTFRIDDRGGCTGTRNNSFYNNFNRAGESDDDLKQRVVASARTANATTVTFACTVTPGGEINGGLGGLVSADGLLTFNKTWAARDRVTVRLQRTK
jgi:hypothetical protein